MYYRLRFFFSIQGAFFFLLRRRRAPFTVHCVLQWILTSRLRVGHRGLCFTMDFDLRFRIASVLQWIMTPWALPPCKTAAIRAPFEKWWTYQGFWPSCSESDERIKDSALRLFRSREALFLLFLVCFQDSSNVWRILFLFGRNRQPSAAILFLRRSLFMPLLLNSSNVWGNFVDFQNAHHLSMIFRTFV